MERSCCSVSTEQGPAMVMNSLPPISRSNTRTTVCWCFELFSTSLVSAKRSCQLARTRGAPFRGRLRVALRPHTCLHPKVEVQNQQLTAAATLVLVLTVITCL